MQQTICITGASDGIGLALARIYQARGARVIAVGRRAPTQLAPELRGDYCRVDLAQPYAAALVANFLRQRNIAHLDLLISNAGIGWYGEPESQPSTTINALIDIHICAPLALTHTLLPFLSGGRVVFIGSLAADLPVPSYAVYGASKAALTGLARSLRVELRGQIGVQVIHPGATRTALHAKSGVPFDQRAWRRFASPERVAEQLVRAIERGKPVATLGLGNRLLRFFGRHCGEFVDQLVRLRRRSLAAVPAPCGAASTPHCVITGGADGIGRALAERYARAGYLVTIVDRDAARANLVCRNICASSGTAHYVSADLVSAAGIASVLRQLAVLPPASIVIHSAGISAVGPFAGLSLEAQQRVLDVNLRAPVQLSAAALQQGLLTPAATIVFIASLSVFTGYPGAAAYAASKDGIAAYARSMRVALASHDMHVLTIFPGPTRTAHARRYSPNNRREARRMMPERLAELIYHAVERRSNRLIPGAVNRLVALLGRIAPAASEQLMRVSIFEKLPPMGSLPADGVEPAP